MSPLAGKVETFTDVTDTALYIIKFITKIKVLDN